MDDDDRLAQLEAELAALKSRKTGGPYLFIIAMVALVIGVGVLGFVTATQLAANNTANGPETAATAASPTTTTPPTTSQGPATTGSAQFLGALMEARDAAGSPYDRVYFDQVDVFRRAFTGDHPHLARWTDRTIAEHLHDMCSLPADYRRGIRLGHTEPVERFTQGSESLWNVVVKDTAHPYAGLDEYHELRMAFLLSAPC